MAKFEPKPDINVSDFNAMFEQKRYYIVALQELTKSAKVTKAQLEKASEFETEPSITGNVVRSLKRNEPVYFEQAVAFVKKINALLDEQGADKLKLDPEDAIEGAFFVVKDLESLMTTRSLTSAELVDAIGGPGSYDNRTYSAKIVDACRSGYRVTMTTGLDIVRALNALQADEQTPLDPRDVLITDTRAGKKAAAKGCFASRNRYTKWPPDTLVEDDRHQPARGAIVERLNPRRSGR